MIADSFTTVLTDIAVDNFHFHVTRHPLERNACILWFCNTHKGEVFEALGRFSQFDRRLILFFIARYVTNLELRQEIEKRRFEAKVGHLSPDFLDQLDRMRPSAKTAAYRNLFNLDSIIEQPDLAAKRRIMAKRFHPDAGGNNRHMTVINEAYEHLLSRA